MTCRRSHSGAFGHNHSSIISLQTVFVLNKSTEHKAVGRLRQEEVQLVTLGWCLTPVCGFLWRLMTFGAQIRRRVKPRYVCIKLHHAGISSDYPAALLSRINTQEPGTSLSVNLTAPWSNDILSELLD